MQYIGSIIGDYCGSIYEWNNFKEENPNNVEILKTGKFTINEQRRCEIFRFA